jgi:hypothetical protein
MKLHSLRLAVLAIAWVCCSSAFTVKKASAKPNPQFFYWYLAANDTFNSYLNTDDEITEQENETGLWVDNNPAGGTLLVRGYDNNNYPHNLLPSVLLYGH